MSKRNMLLGLAGGKVGDLVFYRDGGEQRTRTRVVPKNPRSPKQMAQRVRIANVSAMYRVLAPIVRDSFSNRPSNQSGYNAFASGAIELSPFLTKELASVDAIIPMPAVIGKGVLPSVDAIVNTSSAGPIDILNGDDGEQPANFGVVSQRLLALYPGLSNGSKITMGAIVFTIDPSLSDDVDVYSPILRSFELVIDTTSSAGLSEVGLEYANSQLFPTSLAPYTSVGAVVAWFAIASSVDTNGSLQTSFARLSLSEDAQSLYEDYRTDTALSAALKSYTGGSVQLLR